MLKISRLTDYSVILLSQMLKKTNDNSLSAKDLAMLSGLPLPTVSKLLKLMSQRGLIKAKRGALGGYSIEQDTARLSLLNFIEIFEGPTNITSCLNKKDKSCKLHDKCDQKGAWDMVNTKIKDVLSKILLRDFL